MPTFLCTSRYRKTFRLPERLEIAHVREGALGPWYANILNIGSLRLLHYMSETSLLSVVIPLRERGSAPQRFVAALQELLRDLGVPAAHIEQEAALLADVQYGRASDLSKLGSMRDQARSVRFHVHEESLSEINVRLTENPCGAMNYASPRVVAPSVLKTTWGIKRR